LSAALGQTHGGYIMAKSDKLWVNNTEAVFYITLILFILGTVNIFSASFVLAGQLLHDSYFFLKRHLGFFIIGFITMIVVGRMNYHTFKRFLMPIAIATIGLLIAVHFSGVEANGARRWLNLAGLKFQPSELAKLAVIMITANYLGPRIDRGRAITIFSGPFYFSLLAGVFVLRQPDMGTAVIVVGLSLILYLLAGLPRFQMYLLCSCAAVMGVVGTYAASYRAERIAAWFNPWAYQQTIGYQTVQSLLAIGSGGFLGTGLGMGTSKFYYLPEAHTDFAFAVLCQEMGYIGALVVLVLLMLLGFYGIQIAIKAADGFGKMLALGATALVVGQGVANIAMVTGLLPVIGVPLPFVSFGGTSLIINFFAIGLLLSVGRRANIGISKTADQPEKAKRKLKLVSNRNTV